MRILGLLTQIYGRRCRLALHRPLPPVQVWAGPSMASLATAARPKTRTSQDELRMPRERMTDLGQLLRQMDFRIQRANSVVKKTVESAIAEATRLGRLNAIDGAYLLRSTGEVLRECPPSEREALTKAVWSLIDRSQIDISHYNTLLKVYLENETEFDPQQILVELKEHGIQPNRVTYHRLIEKFCEMKDLVSATKVLEFMKTEQMPISERIFHALIKGHLLANDEEAAFKMLQTMESMQCKPSNETFTVLACGLIGNDKKAKALEVIADQSLSDRQVMRLVKAFAAKGELEAMQSVLETTPLANGSVFDLINTYTELLALNNLPAARAVFDKIPKIGSRTSVGEPFINKMIERGYPVADVLDFCKDLESKEINPQATMKAIRSGLKASDLQTAVEYIKLLPDQGFKPLRPFFFAPIICRAKNEEEVFEILRLMQTMGTRPNEEFVSEFVLPKLRSAHLGEEMVARLCENGCPFRAAVNGTAYVLMRRRHVQQCLTLLQSCMCELTPKLAQMAGTAATPENIDACIGVLQLVVQSQGHQDSADFVDRMVDGFLTRIEDRALRADMSNVVVKRVKDSLQSNQATSSRGGYESLTREQVMQRTQMKAHELESIRAKLDSENKDTKEVLVKLLTSYCRLREAEKVDEVLKQLEGNELNGAAIAALMDFSIFKKDLEAAMKYYRQAKQDKDIFVMDTTVLGLATLLAQSKRLPEAEEIVKCHEFSAISREQTGSRTFRPFVRLIEAIAVNEGTDTARKFIDQVIAPVTPVTGSMLVPLMKLMLAEKSTDEVLTFFKDIVSSYKVTACKREVALKLIEENREEDLAQIKQLCSDLFAKAWTEFEFAAFYAEAGQIEKARAILQTLPLGRLTASIESFCRMSVENRRVEFLEKFVELLGELGCNWDDLYYSLLRGYSVVDDLDKAGELWTKVQEKDVILSARTLRYLANMLKRGGREVPFTAPPDTVVDSSAKSGGTREFQKLLTSSVDEAAAFRQQLKSKGQSLSAQDENKLISALLENGKVSEALAVLNDILQTGSQKKFLEIGMLGGLTTALVRANMMEELDSLWPHFMKEPYDNVPLGDVLCAAYIEANKLPDFLSKLEALPPSRVLGLRWVHLAIESNPECFDRVLEIGKRIGREGQNMSVLNTIWLRLFLSGDYDKADAIMKEFPGLLNANSRMTRVLQRIRETSDEDKCQRLLNLLKDTPLKRLFATAASAQVDILLSQQRVTEAQDRLKQLCQEGLDISLCNIKTLETLKKELALLGKEVEF